MIHKLRLSRIYFYSMKYGKREYEVRLLTEEKRKIKIGDIINFKYSDDDFQKKVADIKYYSTIPDLLKDIPPKKILPDTHTLEECIQVYTSMYGYPKGNHPLGYVCFKITHNY
jgi:ASC-1-like (ASCH) protein